MMDSKTDAIASPPCNLSMTPLWVGFCCSSLQLDFAQHVDEKVPGSMVASGKWGEACISAERPGNWDHERLNVA